MRLSNEALFFKNCHLITNRCRTNAKSTLIGYRFRTDWLLRFNVFIDDSAKNLEAAITCHSLAILARKG
jgi:hypothetical protein